MRALFLFGAVLFTVACDSRKAPSDDVDGGTTAGTDACDPTADSDADGLDDCTEAELGTDSLAADTDGDGSADGDEVACLADPLDADEACYACGWLRNDPGTLQSTGAELGDTVANLQMVDQCGDEVALWDFAGAYTVAFVTAAWCPLCVDEAAALEDEAELLARSTGQPVQGLVILFESRSADTPAAEDAVPYAQQIGAEDLPVFADINEQSLDAIPFDGSELPGVCLLSPRMEILQCGAGQGQFPGLADTIAAHAN